MRYVRGVIPYLVLAAVLSTVLPASAGAASLAAMTSDVAPCAAMAQPAPDLFAPAADPLIASQTATGEVTGKWAITVNQGKDSQYGGTLILTEDATFQITGRFIMGKNAVWHGGGGITGQSIYLDFSHTDHVGHHRIQMNMLMKGRVNSAFTRMQGTGVLYACVRTRFTWVAKRIK